MPKRYNDIGKKFGLPVLVGEFGVTLQPEKNKDKLSWVSDVLNIFNEFGFHWTYWTYKAVYTSKFPNGLYQYIPNDPWTKREGPHFGWENYKNLTQKEIKKMYNSWKTENFNLLYA